jgi:hypothetical protein
MSQAEDLERLARLLDEGKLTQEEYETAKKGLLGPTEAATTPTQAPAGWYPSAEAGHEAYWDGERWTGATRPGSGTGPATSPAKRSGCAIAAIVVGALILLVIVIAVVSVQIAGNEISETFSEIGAGLEDGEDAPSGASDRITLEGEGDGDTASFSLSGGSYSIVTEVGGECFYSFTLEDLADGSRVESITTMDEPGSTTVSLHGIEPGDYYLGVITGPAPSCPWSQRWTSS